MAQLRAQEIVTNRDVVSELIHKSFLARGVAEQRLIVQQNRPKQKLAIRSHGRPFHQQWYEKKDWLCGSGKVCSTGHAYFLSLEFLPHGP